MSARRVVRACRNAALAACAFLAAADGFAEDAVYDNKGFSRNREFAAGLPFEHVDPLTGNLVLTFTDAVLPGNAGFDLKVQRVYNIKIYSSYVDIGGGSGQFVLGEDSPAGLGWTLHFGRVKNVGSETPGPVIEMSDGSSHPSFKHMNGNLGQFMTRDFWTFDRNTLVLRLPNGVRYTFGCATDPNTRYATEIRDPFGNVAEIDYFLGGAPCGGVAPPPPGVQAGAVRRVRQMLATGEVRTVTFDYTPATGTLREMRYEVPGHSMVWTYDSVAVAGTNGYIMAVHPPEGDPWRFEYHDSQQTFKWHLLRQVTTPNGGVVTYDYARQAFYSPGVVLTPALRTRTTSGRSITSGTWSYSYETSLALSPNAVTATIDDSCCRRTIYKSYALNPTSGLPWRVGALESKEVRDHCLNRSLETQTFDWVPSPPISTYDEGGPGSQTHVPLAGEVTVSRPSGAGNTRFFTKHQYHTTNFADFGRAFRTEETGQYQAAGELVRVTDREFFYTQTGDPSFGVFIVDKTKKETVTAGGESYVRTFDHDTDDGFLMSQTILGIKTDFTKGTGGNVKTRTTYRTSARPLRTTLTYTGGVEDDVTTPEYRIARVVNADGTIASQGRIRGDGLQATTFTYDDLLRPKTVDPPEDITHTTRYDYFPDRTVKTRGASSLTSTLDGFARVIETRDAVDVLTEMQYDACGRVSYQSLPFQLGSATLGSRFTWDVLDRVTERRNPDHAEGNPSIVTYKYDQAAGDGGLDIEIRDENARLTTQIWQAFGDPAEARLRSVRDAGSGAGGARLTTTYDYNGLGGLARVTPQSGPVRTWSYFQGTDRVRSETHPESGTVDYTYWSDGLLRTRDDAKFAAVTFEYDGNGRLLEVTRPSPHPKTTFAYDDWDNRTVMDVQGVVRSQFEEYDSNNRLRRRRDIVQSRPFVTKYDWDASDNLERITYPSTAIVRYFHDAENRIEKVTADDAGLPPYAHTFQYHPSGGVRSYRSGNGILNEIAYDARRYWINRTTSGGLLDVQYGHDLVGNVTSLTDSRLGSMTLQYDPVDRLERVLGGTYGGARFTYDPLGNRELKTIGAQTTSYTYDTATKRLQTATGAEGAGFTHDPNGNLETFTPTVPVGAPSHAYTYDTDNMLVKATVGATDTYYAYDGDRLRKRKTTGTDTTYFVHGPGGQVLGEYKPLGTTGSTPAREYVYAGPRPIATVKPAVLTATPDLVAFAVLAGSGTSAPQKVAIEAGTAAVTWTAQASAPWILLSPPSGTTPSPLSVRVNPGSRPVGLYEGTITVSASGVLGSPRVVRVMMAVAVEMGLVVLPRPLRFEATEGDTAVPPQTLHILYASTSPSDQVSWNATASATWVGLAPASGTTPSAVTVTVDPAGRRRGTYRAYANVTATGETKVVPIELVVRPGAGTTCDPADWYCEPFDDMTPGPIDGQRGWSAEGGEVTFDPRGSGKVLRIDAPSIDDGTIGGFVEVMENPIDGHEVSLQIMVHGVGPEQRQIAKVEFQTVPGVAWGKTGRTYGALRFGSRLYLQFGPNVWKVLMDELQNDRWYEVRVAYTDGAIQAFVDGDLKHTEKNPLLGNYPTQRFTFTGWDFPGQANVDLWEARGAEGGLVVEPQPLRFAGRRRFPGPLGKETTAATPTPSPVTGARLPKLPLGFEENRGQAPADVRFVARRRDHAVLLTDDAVVLTAPAGSGGEAVRIGFEGARAALEPLETLPGTVSYFRGNDPRRWATGLRRHGRVRYSGIYPGIDLEVYARDQELEYDLVVAPGADPSQVRLSFDGVVRADLDEDGDLVLETPWGSVRHRRPIVYQEHDGRRVPVEGGYALSGESGARFVLGDYDSSRPLVLDPVVVYSTYVGGKDTTPYDGVDAVTAVNVDADGTLYLAGNTNSLNFATAEPRRIGPPLGVEGQLDVFVAKLNPTGTALEWLTYVGGSNGADARGLAIDVYGRITVVGVTHSDDFPTAGGGADTTYGGEGDGFVFRLDFDGTELEYSTYLGGANEDVAASVDTIPSSGATVVAGTTSSGDFPAIGALPGQDQHHFGTTDAFLTWFDAAGALEHSTFLGGTREDHAVAVDVQRAPDGHPQVYVGGGTSSLDFPTTPGVVGPAIGLWMDGFVTRVEENETGSALQYSYSTYVDAAGGNRVTSMVVDAGGTAHMTQESVDELGHAFNYVMALASNAASIVYSTNLGGGGELNSIAFNGEISVAGLANHFCDAEPCLPYVDAIYEQTSGYSAYVARLAPQATSVRFATDLGCAAGQTGDAYTTASSVTVLEDVTYVVGQTNCTDFPIESAMQPFLAGASDGFVTAISAPRATSFVSFSDVDFHVPEGGEGGTGQAVVTLRRTGTLGSQSSVTLRTSNGSAQAGTDYVATQTTVTFAPGAVTATAAIPLVDDTTSEGAEFFLATLSDPVGAQLGAITTAQVWIDDDDGLKRKVTIRDSLDPSGPATWTITESIPWLAFSATSGMGRGEILATATVLPSYVPGTYREFFVVTGEAGDPHSPQVVEATLEVLP